MQAGGGFEVFQSM